MAPSLLAWAVAAAFAGAMPTASDAAGLGRLTVQSALGQPLRAEVEITALGRDEAGSLSARLASPDAFKQAGLEFNPALGSLRFAVERRPSGSAIVRITSAQPINEPFVDLLVELNWAAGRFVREYTFLLDPPELRLGRDTVVSGGAAQTQIVAPATTSTAPVAAPAAQATPTAPAAEGVARRAQPAAAARVPATPPARSATPASAAPADVTTKPGDTLAGIAARVKPAEVSLDQAIVAIYQANPGAFFGSIHQMMAGKRLAVPGREAMAAVDGRSAARQVRAQAEDYRAYRERLAAAPRRVDATQAGQSASGTVTARVEDKKAPPAGDQLKLSRSQAAARTGGAAGGAGTGDAATEAQVARDAALREQRERIAALEKSVADLQQLVELKNRQLAELQRQVESARAAGTATSGAVAAAGSVAASAPAPQAAKPPASEPAAVPAAESRPSAADEAKPVTEAPKPAVAEEVKPVAEAPKPAAAEEAKPAAPAPAPAPASSEPGFADSLMASPLALPGLGALALALGAWGFYSVRRRRKTEAVEDEGMVTADAFTANSLFGSTGGQAVDTSQGVFATTGGAPDSGIDIHSTEVDPIAEAEVYIAYGREAQAEEILREALKKQPERQAIRLKLLEIFAARKDAVAFAALAQEMYDATGGQNEEWPKVVTLGLSIDPSNPLYTGDSDLAQAWQAEAQAPDPVSAPDGGPAADDLAPPAGLAAAATMLGDRTRPVEGASPEEQPTASFAETVPMDGGLETGEIGRALDFSLDLDTTIGRAASLREAAGAEPAAAAPVDESELLRAIDGRFDLPSLDIESQAGATDERQEDAGGMPRSPAGAEPLALADLGDFHLDLPSLDDLGERVPVAARGAAGGDAGGEFGPGLDLAGADTALAPSGDASRWQEMATKLDLASAYEEIGDKEGARELLEEVLKGGDGAQQQKARSMLAKIG